MSSLTGLPFEVLSYVIDYLTLQDVYCLGRTNKYFGFIFQDERICKSILQTKLRYSTEALAAVSLGGGNARNLRRALKRHDALAAASPFIVATIGFCDAYLYCKGVLCYTLDDRIRVLNLHHSGQSELVISIPSLLSHALPDIGENTNGFFQILYYADYILSCTYRSSGPDSTAWLIAFNLRTRQILVAHELDSTDKIFVRHNKQYLYYGTHSQVGTDGYKKWVIYGFDIKERTWFEQKVHLPDMVGSEIGSTICFELYDGYFYGLSNQTSFEVEEIDWTSFYHCIRFPLSSPCTELLEKTENKSMWRRQHQEGPIDDRWTNLRLVGDESSGELKIVEARKEWYLGSSKSQRTYYTTDLIFPKTANDEDGEGSPNVSFSDSTLQPFVMPSWLPPDPTLSEEYNLSAASTASSTSTASSSSTGSTSSSAPTSMASEDTEIPFFPDEQLRKLVHKDDHPNYIAAPNRRPENTHPGNDGSAQPTITLAKCRLRTYNPSCSTFLDLVDDPHPDDWQGKQRLRLRAGTRNLGPVLRDSTGLLREPSSDLCTALHEMYQVPPITFWPAAQDPNNPDEQLDAVYQLMNPPSHLGNVEGTADERSMVYVTGSHNGPKALIFICFDPSVRLAGLKKWDYWGTSQWGMKGVGEGPHVDGRAAGAELDNHGTRSRKTYIDVGEADRTVSVDRKGKGRECLNTTSMAQVTAGRASVHVQKTSASLIRTRAGSGRGNWAWKERAMYQDINMGFYFGVDQKKKA
ncbi:uncharacterized protein LY89DRAFT_668260 [Mollisia scopiformis]|uniref:F-box domain-containing protein n=1 Tax=Mollisia scopiformis TaxID=149040 RepID=A0A194XD35_MOLSC|nr:uncharacterized protein LY89DRAFT_668260 [Mollisia scopiformis]KUJ18069.1 hypothetical protein LY89DRAFT_668260 [Mollisia scopiformis]